MDRAGACRLKPGHPLYRSPAHCNGAVAAVFLHKSDNTGSLREKERLKNNFWRMSYFFELCSSKCFLIQVNRMQST
ncbi:hypothetical protein SAMN04487894_11198 [Niabella drilacis]|uniref:Uncharacterized protein n=1 Tax=Niabella drilacis (strain DSM 25811 / CCM 8410 / CCUG 62505 / LMG 26954 / E90) TaxID=1285928 RepID=A0A1G6WGC1_NIADE|nr:hypothetical protein SAMN04487894_11198 [Niabella drilacis]